MSQTLVTPHGHHGDSSAMGLAAEKRRNKLGYHRTSVACGHCRRRKIRCIPSSGDGQNRCINCIRLKKDCSFFPVDQQPTPDTRKKSASSTMVPLKLEPFSPDKIPERSSVDYTHGGVTHWIAAAADASPSSPTRPTTDMPWRAYPHESPATPSSFSPYTTTQPASATATATTTWSSQLEAAADVRAADDPWAYPSQPPRSISSFGSDNNNNNNAGGHSAYPSITQMTRGVPHTTSGAGGGPSSYSRKPGSAAAAATATATAASGHLYHHSSSASASVDGLGAVYDGPVPLSTGASYTSWPHTYAYGKDASDSYDWNEHGGGGGVVHATSSMYYAR